LFKVIKSNFELINLLNFFGTLKKLICVKKNVLLINDLICVKKELLYHF
jgi:hypothetical protein